jgi:hypothetical protein
LGKQAIPSATFVAHYLSYYDDSMDPNDLWLYACGDNGADMQILRANMPISSTSDSIFEL